MYGLYGFNDILTAKKPLIICYICDLYKAYETYIF